jgi:uncharacterized protein (TIGR02466 family)
MLKKIVNAFSVPILETQFDNVDALNVSLYENITAMFSDMDDKRLLSYEWNNFVLTDNPKPATGYSSFNHASLVDNPNFKEFFDIITPLITDFFKQLNFPEASPFINKWSFENSWASVYPEGAWVPSHNHGSSHWSGVYYVKADPACGDLIFSDPKEYSLSNEPANTKWRGNNRHIMGAIPGKMYVFPGYVKHESHPNMSGEDRVIISFNIKA